MPGRPRITANRVTALADLAVKLSNGVNRLIPDDYAHDPVPGTIPMAWLDADFEMFGAATTLVHLRDLLRRRAGLPAMPDPFKSDEKPSSDGGVLKYTGAQHTPLS